MSQILEGVSRRKKMIVQIMTMSALEQEDARNDALCELVEFGC
jgi:hypothetical protein